MSIKLEVGKKYVTRDRYQCDYVEITSKHTSASTGDVIYTGETEDKTTTLRQIIEYYGNGAVIRTTKNTSWARDCDLVAEYPKTITTAQGFIIQMGGKYITRDWTMCDYVEITRSYTSLKGNQFEGTFVVNGVKSTHATYRYREDGTLDSHFSGPSPRDIVAEAEEASAQPTEEATRSYPEPSSARVCKHQWVNCSFSENPDDANLACKHCGVGRLDLLKQAHKYVDDLTRTYEKELWSNWNTGLSDCD